MPDRSVASLLGVTMFFIDVICLGLLISTSSIVLYVLLRHMQQVQHIHIDSLSLRPSHEARATCTILILVSSFDSFYFLSSSLSLSLLIIVNQASGEALPLLIALFSHIQPLCAHQ